MGNSLRVLHGVIVRRKLPISKLAAASALKIISYLPCHGHGRMSIPLALNQQNRGLGLKQVRRHILMQDVRPPAIRVSTPNLCTERISFDLLKLVIRMLRYFGRDTMLKYLAEGMPRRGREDNNGGRIHFCRQN